MRILVTLGGTSERIDQVRSITNHSTGKLGNEIVLALEKASIFVDVIATDTAIQPIPSTFVTIRKIHDTNDLYHTLSELMSLNTYDAVIHSMAVSDFTTQTSFSEEGFLTSINDWIASHPNQTISSEALEQLLELSISSNSNETKLSSATNHLVLFLKKTPKVIQLIKQIQPDTLLVGFKLLVDVTKEELFAVALNSLEKSHADYILANDLTSISKTTHTGYLLDKTGVLSQAETKSAIAQMIVNELQSAIATKEK